MGKLQPEDRRALGEVANQVKAELEALLARRGRAGRGRGSSRQSCRARRWT